MGKLFDLGDVLSVTGTKLVSPRLIGGVYDILGFMTGESLYTHQLIRGHKVCGPYLLKQYPELASVDDSEVNGENCFQWLAAQKAKYGEALAVEPLPEGVWESIDPLAELEAMVGKDRVIVVSAE